MSVKEWLMMGTKKVGVLSSPQKKTVIFISEKKRTCKEHELAHLKSNPTKYRLLI